jgi:hypothetical protein
LIPGIRHQQFMPRDIEGLAQLGARLTLFFAAQGSAILAYYALTSGPADPSRLPLGLQLDPIHAAVHLAIGLAGGYVGFVRPAAAIFFMQVFGLLYLALAVFGTFTSIHFGMELAFNENALHWSVGTIAVVIGFRLIPGSMFRSTAE